MSSYLVNARRFIHEIAPFLVSCRSAHDYDNAIHYYNRSSKNRIKCKWGQTRVVLIGTDFVVKIDYGHRARYYGGCEDELMVYKRAVRAGYGEMFARISPCYYHGKMFYIMPFVHDIGTACDDAWAYVDEDLQDWFIDNVEDLHYNNFGFEDGHIVLVDYACRADRAPVNWDKVSSFNSCKG